MNYFDRLLTIMNGLGGTTEDELMEDAMFQQAKDRVWKSYNIIEYFALIERAAKRVLWLRQLRR